MDGFLDAVVEIFEWVFSMFGMLPLVAQLAIIAVVLIVVYGSGVEAGERSPGHKRKPRKFFGKAGSSTNSTSEPVTKDSSLAAFKYQEKHGALYERRCQLLSYHELRFYNRLVTVCEKRGLSVFCKVRMADVIWVPDSLRNEAGEDAFWEVFRPLAQKHVDFVVCDENSRYLLAIELDDSSHDTQDAKNNDWYKNHVFKQVELPLERVRGTMDYARVCDLIDKHVPKKG